MTIPDYYQRLGVAESATEEEIKREFRRLAKEFHPDLNPGDKAAEQRFKELSEAYDVLSDSEKRREYDQIRRNGSFEESFRSRRGPSGGHEQFDHHADNSMSFEDLFGSLFGGGDPLARQRGSSAGRTRGRTQAKRGRDLESTIEIPFVLAVRGGKQRVTVAEGRTLDVAIPAGIESGSRIRLTGQGEKGSGTVHGDLYLQIQIRPDQVYQRQGNDIIKRVRITLKEALLGTIRTESFVDRDIKVTIPPLTSPGSKLRLRGLGVHGGDGFIEIEVTFPVSLSEKVKQLADELPS